MAVIKYESLLRYLTENELFSRIQALRIINRIRKLDPEIKKEFFKWFCYNRMPLLTIEGVTFEELINAEKMRPVRAFLFMDWLKREPVIALTYMAQLNETRPLQDLTEKDVEKLKTITVKLNLLEVDKQEEKEIENEEDIHI